MNGPIIATTWDSRRIFVRRPTGDYLACTRRTLLAAMRTCEHGALLVDSRGRSVTVQRVLDAHAVVIDGIAMSRTADNVAWWDGDRICIGGNGAALLAGAYLVGNDGTRN